MAKRWLVPVDFSAASMQAATMAATELEAGVDTLHILHVYTVPPLPMSYDWTSAPSLPATVQEWELGLRSDVARSLERFVLPLRTRFPTLTIYEEVAPGAPAEAILRIAAEHGVDRIVLATGGRTGLAHLLLGSIAERVARLAPCSVLITKPPPGKPCAGAHPQQ
ncbi:MAG: universal stress protein [Myxococcota bacterium]